MDDDCKNVRFSVVDWTPILASEGERLKNADLLSTKNTVTINPRGFMNVCMTWVPKTACNRDTMLDVMLLCDSLRRVVAKCC